jgi:CTP synthase
MVDGLTHPIRTINIGLAGKYTALDDSYISVVEALKHAGAAHKTKIQIHHLNTETCEGEDREEVITRFVAEHQIS